MTKIQSSKKMLLEQCIIFDPSRRELINNKDKCVVKLQNPANNCLQLLVEKFGYTVSQEELICYGWGKQRQISVSSNTYYQCILHLRKALNEIGLKDAIITVPRHGLTLRNDISVSYIEEAKKNESDVNPDSGEQEISELIASNKYLDTVTESNNYLDSVSESKNISNPLKYKCIRFYSTFFITTLLCIWFGLTLMDYKNKEYLERNYIKIDTAPCNLYVNNNILKAEEIKSLLKAIDLSCVKDAVIFADTTTVNARINVLYCTRYTLFNQNCRVILFMKEGDAQ